MTVKELIIILKTLNPELDVVTAIDDEGNGYRLVPNGWVSVEKFTEDYESTVDEEDWDEYDNLTTAVCIG